LQQRFGFSGPVSVDAVACLKNEETKQETKEEKKQRNENEKRKNEKDRHNRVILAA
jgi:hypothetical protein